MASVNQCDQCGKVQKEHYDILLTVVHDRQERTVEGLFGGMMSSPSVTATDFEFCSFECAAMACHLMAVQKDAVNA